MQDRLRRLILPALFLLVFCHATLTFLFSLSRLYGGKASLLDVGLFDQVLWNLLHHGQPLTTATLPFTEQHWLGFHFSPILYTLLPFYALWPSPEFLQVVQSLLFAVAAIPLFLAFASMGLSLAEALFATMLYLCSPLLLAASLWDFHEIAFATFFMSWAIWAFTKKSFVWLCLFLALLLCTKEHYGVSVAGFGLLWGWHYKDWKRGGALMVAGVLSLYLVIAIIMPLFHGGQHAMFGNSSDVVGRYGWLFAAWQEKISTLHTLMLGDGTSQITGIMYLVLLLISGLLLPLAAPIWLAPAAADVLANLLSTNPMPRHTFSYHSASIIPVLIMAATQGYLQIVRIIPNYRHYVVSITGLLALLLLTSGLITLPFRFWEITLMPPGKEAHSISTVESLVGSGSLSAQPNIGIYFSQRRFISPFPHRLEQSDFAVLNLTQPFADPDRQHFNIPFGMDTRTYVSAVRQFLSKPDWHVALWQNRWLVMARGAPDKDETPQRLEIAHALDVMLEAK